MYREKKIPDSFLQAECTSDKVIHGILQEIRVNINTSLLFVFGNSNFTPIRQRKLPKELRSTHSDRVAGLKPFNPVEKMIPCDDFTICHPFKP
jgi:hypothetical protein